MDRRNFLGLLVGGIATAAAVRTWPFRVYSFPSEPLTFPVILDPRMRGRIDYLDTKQWGRILTSKLYLYDKERMVWVAPQGALPAYSVEALDIELSPPAGF